MSTITAANSVFTLGASGLFNVPVKIQGYSADDAFTVEDVQFMEKYMGVDGHLSAGWTPYIVPLDFTLSPDSPSIAIMNALVAAEKATREKIQLNASILIPSLGLVFAFTTGYLDKGAIMPAAGKVLKPMKYSLAFQDMSAAPAL
jgi:hypothetical protein